MGMIDFIVPASVNNCSFDNIPYLVKMQRLDDVQIYPLETCREGEDLPIVEDK